jgi:hypothetical protein
VQPYGFAGAAGFAAGAALAGAGVAGFAGAVVVAETFFTAFFGAAWVILCAE